MREDRDSTPVEPVVFGPKDWLFAAALLAAVALAYQPAWNGRFIWDDNAHVTRPDLRSAHGLGRIWFELGATQQDYPLAHSAFWADTSCGETHRSATTWSTSCCTSSAR